MKLKSRVPMFVVTSSLFSAHCKIEVKVGVRAGLHTQVRSTSVKGRRNRITHLSTVNNNDSVLYKSMIND